MTKTKTVVWAFVSVAMGAILVVAGGCAGGGGGATTQPAEPSNPPLSGVQVWSQNCMRCHNMISPNRYGDRQWDVVVRVMRVRAGLTSDEEKAILDFLKTAD